MFTENIPEEVKQAHHRATSPSHQLDWRWVERYREMDAFDAYWWWAQAGPFSEEEQRQWEKLYRPAPDEATKEALRSIIAQSRRREFVAAFSEQREPHFWYPALEIAEVRRRITGMLHLEADISEQEPNALVRGLYQGAIEEEVCFLRLIEATYEGDSERFVQLDQRLHPTPEEMEDALVGLRACLRPGKACRHLIEALVQAQFGHLHHVTHRPVVFCHGHFGLAVPHVFEGDGMTLILRKIRWHPHCDRINLLAVFISQVMDVFDPLHWHDFLVPPGAVVVSVIW